MGLLFGALAVIALILIMALFVVAIIGACALKIFRRIWGAL